MCGTITTQLHNWQVLVPQLALQNDFLMRGLLSMAALEKALFVNPADSHKYLEFAIQQYHVASRQFQHELYSFAPEKHQSLLALATFFLAIELGMTRFDFSGNRKRSTLSHVMTYFALLRGVVCVAVARPDLGREEPLQRDSPHFGDLPSLGIEPDTRTALDRLISLNEDIHRDHPRIVPLSAESQTMTYYTASGKALIWLEECFARCVSPETGGMCVVWPLMGGRAYETALQEEDPVALLVLMHWATLLEAPGCDTWYINGIGRKLAEEISTKLAGQTDPRFQAGIDWARKRVDWTEFERLSSMRYRVTMDEFKLLAA